MDITSAATPAFSSNSLGHFSYKLSQPYDTNSRIALRSASLVTAAHNIPNVTPYPLPSTFPVIAHYGSADTDIPDIYKQSGASLQFTLAIAPYLTTDFLIYKNVGKTEDLSELTDYTRQSLPWYDHGATHDYIISSINTEISATTEWKNREFRLDIRPTNDAAVMLDLALESNTTSPRSYVCTLQFLLAGTFTVPDLQAYIIRIVDIVDGAITSALVDTFIEGNTTVNGEHKVWRLCYDYTGGKNLTGIPTTEYQAVKFTSADVPTLIRAQDPSFRSNHIEFVCSEYYITNTLLPTISVTNPRCSYILAALLGIQPRLPSEYNNNKTGYQDVSLLVQRTGPNIHKYCERVYRAYHTIQANPTQYISIQCDQIMDSEVQGQWLPVLYQKPVDEQFNGRFVTLSEYGVRLRARTDVLTFRILLSDGRPIAPSTSVQQLRIDIISDYNTAY